MAKSKQKHRSAAAPVIERERGVPLTIWLILLVVAGVWTAYGRVDIYLDWVGRGSPRLVVPSWIFLVQGVLAVTNVFAVILLWRWQKVGFYLITISTIIAVLIALLVFESGALSFLPLVGLAILYALLRPKWALFV